jgi:HEAT repeat protein
MVAAARAGQPPRADWSGPRTDLLTARARHQDDLATALIALLDHENGLIKAAAAGHSALPSDFDAEGYYIDLVYTVAGLRDPRALHALIPAIGNGQPMRSAIAEFGETAVPDVMAALNDPRWSTRLGAIETLDLLVQQQSTHPLTGNSLNVIRSRLLASLRTTTDWSLRLPLINALESFSGDDIRAVMEQIAAREPPPARPLPAGARNLDPGVAARQWLARHPR